MYTRDNELGAVGVGVLALGIPLFNMFVSVGAHRLVYITLPHVGFAHADVLTAYGIRKKRLHKLLLLWCQHPVSETRDDVVDLRCALRNRAKQHGDLLSKTAAVQTHTSAEPTDCSHRFQETEVPPPGGRKPVTFMTFGRREEGWNLHRMFYGANHALLKIDFGRYF